MNISRQEIRNGLNIILLNMKDKCIFILFIESLLSELKELKAICKNLLRKYSGFNIMQSVVLIQRRIDKIILYLNNILLQIQNPAL